MERRSTTAEDTKRSKTVSLSGSQPTSRQRRASASYSNVDLYNLFGVSPNQVLDQAVKSKKIFSGYRKDVSWSTGFATGFWDDCETTAGWQCAKQKPGCEHPNFTHDHSDLEIGHRHGFYSTVGENVNTYTVCDGTNHWQVMLFGDVVTANEDYSNLEPQCNSCNRDSGQQKRDDRGGGKYQPEKAGACPGGSCTVTKIGSL